MSGRLLIRRDSAARAIAQLPERVSGWPLQVERLARGSRLKISVESGFARLIWPERVSATDALAFFEQHREWLEQTVRVHRQAVDRAAVDLALDPRWPGRVPWFGRLLPIHFEHGPARLDVDTQAIRCRVPKCDLAAAKAAQRLIIAGLAFDVAEGDPVGISVQLTVTAGDETDAAAATSEAIDISASDFPSGPRIPWRISKARS